MYANDMPCSCAIVATLPSHLGGCFGCNQERCSHPIANEAHRAQEPMPSGMGDFPTCTDTNSGLDKEAPSTTKTFGILQIRDMPQQDVALITIYRHSLFINWL